MRALLISITAISCLLVSPRAWSIEPLTAAQLQQACVEFPDKQQSPYSALCIYYVKERRNGGHDDNTYEAVAQSLYELSITEELDE